MRVVYNGVDLGVLKTEVYEYTPVYDDSGVDYLYTRVALVVRCVVNGFVQVQNGPFASYRFTGPTPPATTGGTQPTGAAGGNAVRPTPNLPVTSDGIGPPPAQGISDSKIVGFDPPPIRAVVPDTNAPVLTHATVRHRLSLPCGKLYIFSSGGALLADVPPKPEILSLESPEPGRVCDCKNGPFPRVLAVPEVMSGDRTFFVDWAVETFVNECEVNGTRPSGILLSHRFSQSHGLTDDYRTAISTRGVAVFRTDLVYAIPQNPDYMRRVLFMPIPQGFVRGVPVVRGREDVTGVEYEYTDTQQAVNFIAGPYCAASRIEAMHRQAILSDADVLGGALAAYEKVLNLAAYRSWAKQSQQTAHEEFMSNKGQPPPVARRKAPGTGRTRGTPKKGKGKP